MSWERGMMCNKGPPLRMFAIFFCPPFCVFSPLSLFFLNLYPACSFNVPHPSTVMTLLPGKPVASCHMACPATSVAFPCFCLDLSRLSRLSYCSQFLSCFVNPLSLLASHMAYATFRAFPTVTPSVWQYSFHSILFSFIILLSQYPV